MVIRPENFSRWLDCLTQEPRDVADLLAPVGPGYLEAIPISDLVNKVANTGPNVQEPLAEVPATQAEPEKRAARRKPVVPDAPERQLKLF